MIVAKTPPGVVPDHMIAALAGVDVVVAVAPDRALLTVTAAWFGHKVYPL
jgi:hypothetical protein